MKYVDYLYSRLTGKKAEMFLKNTLEQEKLYFYLRVIKLRRNSEVDHESKPWSNISPRGELEPVRRACFPSIPSNVCAIK